MARTISILSDQAINQIAAGEVVEGPASVVKELIENSIDSGASKVAIEIKGGGHFLIEVSDDGKGMSAEDVEMSIKRYATSKINEFEDLEGLTTMGFRGEALAAISSVSNCTIESSTGGVGVVLTCSGGKDIKIFPCGRKRGTSVKIENLFFNTPARKKFQKARGPSTTEVIKCITNLSLCHKEVGFSLKVDEKEVFYVEGGALNRLEEVLGKDFFAPKVLVDFFLDGIRVQGVIAPPEKTRSNRLGQYLIVNRRNVYSLLVSNAVAAGFGTSIGKGDFPLFFLELTFDPSKIDVNVHPQKKEVRFQEEENVFKVVREAIISSLTGSFKEEKRGMIFPKKWGENSFKEFNFVDKKDEISLASYSGVKSFVPSFFEDKGSISIKMLWDELVVVEVVAPHPKFTSIEEKGNVLIDLSVLEREQNSKQICLSPQYLLNEEEIFLTKGEIAVCEKYKSSFNEMGIFFSQEATSVKINKMPDIAKKSVEEIFLYVLHLLESGQMVEEIKEKIINRVLRKKKYTEEEAVFLIEKSRGENLGTTISKKDIRSLCKEYIS
jgi:DNA mismatch repair protein MutL